MTLSMLRERAAAGRPIRIGQIGAGKFGTMFLSQVRLTPGMHLVGLADLMPARARERLAGVGWPKEQIARHVDGRRAEVGQDLRHRRCAGRDLQPRHRRGDRGDRRSGDRHQALPGGDPARQAHRHGQRGGRRAGRAAAGAAGARGGRRLLAGLGRPAGADLRARRLGARLRLPGGVGRQGHALSPELSPVHARHGVGHPRAVPADPGSQPHQSQDVQLVPRRHQVGHRDDGGVQRHGAGAAVGRAVASRRPRASSWPRCASPGAKAAPWRRRA